MEWWVWVLGIVAAIVTIMIRQLFVTIMGKQDKEICDTLHKNLNEKVDKIDLRTEIVKDDVLKIITKHDMLDKKVDKIDMRTENVKEDVAEIKTNVAVILSEVRKRNGTL